MSNKVVKVELDAGKGSWLKISGKGIFDK